LEAWGQGKLVNRKLTERSKGSILAFKLTKKQVAERNALAAGLRLKAARLAVAITDYNETLSTVAPAVRGAIDAYNEAIEAARTFVNEIAEPAREEYDDKSPRWQESEKGTEADRWINEWEAISLEDSDIEPAEPLDEIDPSELAGQMEDLPDGPENP
jgi:hypothetical protein